MTPEVVPRTRKAIMLPSYVGGARAATWLEVTLAKLTVADEKAFEDAKQVGNAAIKKFSATRRGETRICTERY